MKTTAALILLAFTLLYVPTAQADTFGGGANQFAIEFVPIGDPDNPDDNTGNPDPAGKVEYAYRMGKYEISRDMVTKANNEEGSLGITLQDMTSFGGNGANRSATGVTWLETARFVNWLNTSQGHQAAYNFDNSNNFQLWASTDAWQTGGENLFRHKDAYYFLPSMDEWYKAAYYDASSSTYFNFPTGSDAAPTPVSGGTTAGTAVYGHPGLQGPADITNAGGLSPYGVMGLGGNVFEWEETELHLVNNTPLFFRGLRGGSWDSVSGVLAASDRSINGSPTIEDFIIDFRVASIPEPSTGLLGVLGMLGLMQRRRRSS
ncbi:MAG: SUMF1/EgtB/PvdO family nonheme iron enzyme [Planctomycetota bacterium]|nr:SUMF1/EgtB/PvdO family nonheme iron enzyme [Planctomycetota bacterium]